MSNGTPSPASTLRNIYDKDCTRLVEAGNALQAIGNVLNDTDIKDWILPSDATGLHWATRIIGYQLCIEAESMQKQIQEVLDTLEDKEMNHEN